MILEQTDGGGKKAKVTFSVPQQLLGDRKSHLCLPDKLIRISPRYRKTKAIHNKVSQNNLNFYQDDHVPNQSEHESKTLTSDEDN